MPAPQPFGDPQFWPLLFVALIAVVCIAAMVRVTTLAVHRERERGSGRGKARPLDRLALKTLVLRLFTADEFRHLLQLRLGEGGRAVARAVPTGVSLEGQVIESLEALERHGLLDDVFFDALVRERPRREADIRRVQRGGSVENRRAA